MPPKCQALCSFTSTGELTLVTVLSERDSFVVCALHMRKLKSTFPKTVCEAGMEGCSSDSSALLLHQVVLRGELWVKATGSSWPWWCREEGKGRQWEHWGAGSKGCTVCGELTQYRADESLIFVIPVTVPVIKHPSPQADILALQCATVWYTVGA